MRASLAGRRSLQAAARNRAGHESAGLKKWLEYRGRKAYYRKNQKPAAYDVSRTRFAPPRLPGSTHLGPSPIAPPPL
jgi:hypothetical protein